MDLYKINQKYKIILASQSPRRVYLLKELGLEFEQAPSRDVQELFPDHLSKREIPIHLARLKSDAYADYLADDTLLITADTIVWKDNRVISKPMDLNDAREILKDLSGDTHEVITGVNLRSTQNIKSFYSESKVFFDDLSDDEIDYYLSRFMPMDKAGAYGIQEWIGYVGIKAIEGSFYNVMGLPVHQLYREILSFL
jgi:septum formation protein